MSKPNPYTVPKPMQATYDAVVCITDAVCQAHLTDEYADLCRRLAAKLARKRPSPLATGQPKSWAAGILYTIARVNFLFDKSQTPYMSATDLCRILSVSQGTATAKSGRIMDMFRITQMHPEWCLPSRLDDNLLAWLISVNGLLIDARHAPLEIQQEAFRLGLIPYIPSS